MLVSALFSFYEYNENSIYVSRTEHVFPGSRTLTRFYTLSAEKAMAPSPAILQKQILKCSIRYKSQVPQLKIKMSY